MSNGGISPLSTRKVMFYQKGNSAQSTGSCRGNQPYLNAEASKKAHLRRQRPKAMESISQKHLSPLPVTIFVDLQIVKNSLVDLNSISSLLPFLLSFGNTRIHSHIHNYQSVAPCSVMLMVTTLDSISIYAILIVHLLQSKFYWLTLKNSQNSRCLNRQD